MAPRRARRTGPKALVVSSLVEKRSVFDKLSPPLDGALRGFFVFRLLILRRELRFQSAHALFQEGVFLRKALDLFREAGDDAGKAEQQKQALVDVAEQERKAAEAERIRIEAERVRAEEERRARQRASRVGG